MRRLVSSAGLAAALALTLTTVSASAEQGSLADVRKLVDRGAYTEALEALKPASGKDAAAADLLRAEIELRTGKYAEAEKSAERAAKDKALKPAAVALRAEALAARGKVADAIAALRDVEAEPEARRARLLLGEYLIQTGKRADARAPLMTLIQDYNNDTIKSTDADGLTMVGRAAHLLRSARDANDAYNDAEKAGGKTRIETLLSRADLFLDKYNPGGAGAVVKEAEALAPNDPRVRVMKARVMLENAMDFDGADSELRRALSVNPALPSAFFVKAGLALRDLDIEAADKAADQGLATNPNDLELLSMKAAIRFLADDPKGFDTFEKKVLGLNPEYSRFYQVVGEFAEWEHRYDDIVSFMEKATNLDPRDAKAYAALGLNLIRAGKEDQGVEALRKAWEKDKFNVRVFNTLNLYERDIANGYLTVQGQTFRMRYAKDDQAVLERYVPRLLEEAWGSMVKRYQFTPKTPVSIELYADEEHFSVRTSGLPNVGIQGVCFGQTLAFMSPRAAPFNWGNVLWHELGHVFAIQLSKNHVPRWYTEGLSEYETIVRRPEWQREEDPQLYAALKGGRIPAVAGFNRAFTHVDSVEEVTMAYYAASQIVVFMVERYGWDKVVSMMPKWANGQKTPEVVQASLGVSAAELDREYRAWLQKKLARYDGQYVPDLHAPSLEDAEDAVKKAPADGRKLVELAIARFRAGKQKEGQAALAEAIRVDPSNPDASYILADLALEKEGDEKANAAAAKQHLDKMIANKHDGYAVRMKLASIALAMEDTKGARDALAAASKLDPSQPEPVANLIKIARKLGDERTEIAELSRYVLLEQHDRAAWGRLLEGLVARGRWEEAAKVGEGAVFVDLANPEVHRLYARALAKTGRHVTAVYEYNSAIVAGAPPSMLAEIYRELAKGYDKLGQPKLAEQARAFEKTVAARAAK
ncbi:MAG: tetratricopeptide repeat protein [Myxococcales bacterium]|nr:tetratricopeptide repeat protein [Myxococcales bacterium]